MKKYIALAVVLALGTCAAHACTSMIVGARASASGRPLLWKHRDTGTLDNFVQRVPARDKADLDYVALFNAGDSLLREAWMGYNDSGFAIMNTASYNLAPDTAKIKDREGLVMSAALRRCRTFADFTALLDTLPKPMGVQANFGIVDAQGNGGYVETDDWGYKVFPLPAVGPHLLVRTNYSESGNDTDGMGYIRCQNVYSILGDKIKAGAGFEPADFTENVSRSFVHSLMGKDFGADTTYHYVVDQDFIPRRISSASIVIEGVKPGRNDNSTVMWTAIGYPPCSYVVPVTVDNVPAELQPTAPKGHSPLCDEVMERKAKAFSITRGSGNRYVNLDYLRSITPDMRARSAAAYAKRRK